MTSKDSPMRSAPEAADLAEDPRLVEVAEDYLRELEAGRLPDRAAYLQRYPELASAISDCLDGLEMVHAGLSGKRLVAPAAQRPEEPPGQFAAPLGDFQIIKELARGGMGVVYEAVQLSLGRRVALKVLPFAATFDARHLQRFKNEAQAAALLHHTHIVPIYAVGCERGVHFYAMQLIEGQSLAVVIQQLREKEGHAPKPLLESTLPPDGAPGRVEETQRIDQAARSTVDLTNSLTSGASRQGDGYIRRAARLLVQAAEALEHAHQEGVVHRDIKPANLLLDTSGKLWITDFGLALLQAENGLTRSGDMLGTFRYMSPEQTSGQRTMLDHRTDIYSLGATFYELLTLEPVFSGETHQELLYQILHAEPRSPREHNRAIPIELETILLKGLSKNPADRYRTAADFGADVQRFLEHQPILARRPSLIDRLCKWSRRHPSAVIAAGVLLVIVTGLSLVSNRRIALEQQRTTAALEREKLRAQEAEDRFLQARQAVDSLFLISEEELADRPTDSARRRVLELVLSYYQAFIEDRAGDPAAQAELGRVQDKIKNILHELNVVQREFQLHLLNLPAVRQELVLSDEQESQLQALLALWAEEREQQREEFGKLREEQRRGRLVAIAQEHESALAAVLTSAQQSRFRQLALQSQGIFAFKDPDVVRALELTTEQRGKIREIEREMFAAHFRGPPPERDGQPRFRPPPGPGGPKRGGPGFGPVGMPQANAAAVAQVKELLTETQLQTWRSLTGEPFTGFADGFPPPFGPPPPR